MCSSVIGFCAGGRFVDHSMAIRRAPVYPEILVPTPSIVASPIASSASMNTASTAVLPDKPL